MTYTLTDLEIVSLNVHSARKNKFSVNVYARFKIHDEVFGKVCWGDLHYQYGKNDTLTIKNAFLFDEAMPEDRKAIALWVKYNIKLKVKEKIKEHLENTFLKVV